jgi:hypothetical protein
MSILFLQLFLHAVHTYTVKWTDNKSLFLPQSSNLMFAEKTQHTYTLYLLYQVSSRKEIVPSILQNGS